MQKEDIMFNLEPTAADLLTEFGELPQRYEDLPVRYGWNGLFTCGHCVKRAYMEVDDLTLDDIDVHIIERDDELIECSICDEFIGGNPYDN